MGNRQLEARPAPALLVPASATALPQPRSAGFDDDSTSEILLSECPVNQSLCSEHLLAASAEDIDYVSVDFRGHNVVFTVFFSSVDCAVYIIAERKLRRSRSRSSCVNTTRRPRIFALYSRLYRWFNSDAYSVFRSVR